MNVEIEATGSGSTPKWTWLTACSAEPSDNYAFKPIHYAIFEEAHSDGGR